MAANISSIEDEDDSKNLTIPDCELESFDTFRIIVLGILLPIIGAFGIPANFTVIYRGVQKVRALGCNFLRKVVG